MIPRSGGGDRAQRRAPGPAADRPPVGAALRGLVAESAAARAAVALARRAAASEIAVLFEGESGVGKEVFARAVHADSGRAHAPFVAVNCGALPETLVESILFGHERGAFTGAAERRPGKFAEADGGVLFLDEIGELPPSAQVKLLRAVQEGEVDPLGAAHPRRVDIRLLAATNRDLRREVAEGRFREDLYYRISAFPVRIPPLRSRREDIAPLALRLLARLAAGADAPPIAPEALRALEARAWPGNVRELENALHRALVLADGGPLRPEHLPPPDPAPAASDAPPDTTQADATQADATHADATHADGPLPTLAQVEAAHIRLVLARCDGRMAEAARRLGIGRSTLYRKLADLGIDGGRG